MISSKIPHAFARGPAIPYENCPSRHSKKVVFPHRRLVCELHACDLRRLALGCWLPNLCTFSPSGGPLRRTCCTLSFQTRRGSQSSQGLPDHFDGVAAALLRGERARLAMRIAAPLLQACVICCPRRRGGYRRRPCSGFQRVKSTCYCLKLPSVKH